MSAERRFDLALGLIGAGAVAFALLVLLAPGTAAATVGGVGLELVVPGCALSALVFTRGELRAHELVLTALGTSLVVAALGALLLDRLPGDLGRTPWLILLSALTFLALGAAVVVRRPRRVPGAINERAPLVLTRFEDEDDARLPRWFVPSGWNWIFAALALALVIGAVLLARDAARESPGFSELSALPVSASGGGRQLRVTVRNEEGRPVSYRLRILGAGAAPEESSFRLAAGESRRVLSGRLGEAGDRVNASLYRGAAREPFLHASFDPALGQSRKEGH